MMSLKNIIVVLAYLSIAKPESTDNTTDSTTDSTTGITELFNITTSCMDDNENCTFTTTETPPQHVSNNSNVNQTKLQHAHEPHRKDKSICPCNLQVHVCDVNCCCDPECSNSDKTIFKYCHIDRNRFYDDRYCNYVKHIYINNTALEWEVNQDGLFCVVTRNLPESYILQKEEPIKAAEVWGKTQPFWAESFAIDEHFIVKYKRYVFGDSIVIIRNDSKFDVFRLPRNLLTDSCIFTEDVSYLKDHTITCSQFNMSAANVWLSFPSFFKNFKVITNPNVLNLTQIKGNFYKNCPKNVCLEIEPKLCDSHFDVCSNLTNSTKIDFRCSFDLRNSWNRCQNAVKKILYKFYHNGTNGLYKVEVLGVLSNFTYNFGPEDFQFNQDFSVNFLWMRSNTKNYSELFSGNPGYIAGKPVLIAWRTNKANRTIIQRNSSEFISNFWTFPKDIYGLCMRNETFNVPIEFLYNMRTKCMFRSVLSFSGKQNASTMCRKIQTKVFDFWEISKSINDSLCYGFFGNALTENSKDWNEVIYKINPVTFLNGSQGVLLNKNSTLVCYNISTIIDIQVFHARVDFETLLNQQKILGIGVNFLNMKKVVFDLTKIDKNNVSAKLRFELISQVSFVDITSKKEKKFVEPPSFDIHLPYDFFYPFIKVDNGGSRGLLLNFNLLLIMCSLVINM